MTRPPATSWRTSSYTKTSYCVEVGRTGDGVAVRDTKNRAGGYFTTSRKQWSAFVSALKDGRFDT
ncbi:DUF397 domain-containing protein [Saccharopolyspora rosea]|uniref:DUF397 domain-containing protein n=1 Tax=Saccharopolyspora rosea TaxID=524884 RepID=UPI0021D8E20C|nr:DUF397 domain-containing protein [Saccharopolyspora rosea]